jgi:hypothetical protein
MSLPIKFMIGLFLLLMLGSFLSSLYDPSGSCSGTTVSDVMTNFQSIGNSYEGLNIKSLVSVSYSSGVFVKSMFDGLGAMIWWDFCWFNDYAWIKNFLIVINFAVLLYIIVDLAKLLKPFGG